MRLATLILFITSWLPPAFSHEGLSDGDWAAHGLNSDAKTDLQRHLAESVERGDVPGGALILMHHREIVFREGFGFGHIRRQVPFTADSPFRIASISKPIIATLAVKLDDEGVLDLNAPIDRYLPVMSSLKLTDGSSPDRMPLIRECLKHTAGFLTDYDEGGRPWLIRSGKGFTLEQVVTIESEIPMTRQPGEKFAYSGIGYDIVGRIIEFVSHRSLDQVLQSELCGPLGMTNTTYYPDTATRDHMPSFYWQWRSDGKFRRRLDPPPIPKTDYVSVGGGIVSTLNDLARFMLLHRDGGRVGNQRWIGERAIERMYVRKKPGSFYGLGFTLGPNGEDGLADWIFHSGSSGTMIWWDRRRDVIGVFVTQHSRSAGEKMPETRKLIPKDTPTWQAVTKAIHIDPVMGWTDAPVGITKRQVIDLRSKE